MFLPHFAMLFGFTGIVTSEIFVCLLVAVFVTATYFGGGMEMGKKLGLI